MHSIVMMSFSYQTGNMMYSTVHYWLKIENNIYIAMIKPDGVPDEQLSVFPVDESFVLNLENILIRYKVGDWNGFNKVDKRVLDGTGFSLNVRFASDKSIHASGYVSRPARYAEVRNALDSAFMGLLTNQ